MTLEFCDLFGANVRFYDPGVGDLPPANPSDRFQVMIRLDDNTVHMGGDDLQWHKVSGVIYSGTGNLVLATPNGSSGIATLRALVAADIPNLPASQINSGTFDIARIPTIPAANVSGLGSLATLNAVGSAQITDGSIATDDLGDDIVTLAKVAHGTAGKYMGFNGSGVPSELDAPTAAYPKSWHFWHKDIRITAGLNAMLKIKDPSADFGVVWRQGDPSANGDTWKQYFVCDAGTYDFEVVGVGYTSQGSVTWYIDDVSFGSTDFYQTVFDWAVSKTITGISITAGGHVLKGVISKNASSSLYNVNLSWYALKRQTY